MPDRHSAWTRQPSHKRVSDATVSEETNPWPATPADSSRPYPPRPLRERASLLRVHDRHDWAPPWEVMEYGKTDYVFTGGAGACRSDGIGASGGDRQPSTIIISIQSPAKADGRRSLRRLRPHAPQNEGLAHDPKKEFLRLSRACLCGRGVSGACFGVNFWRALSLPFLASCSLSVHRTSVRVSVFG